MRLVVSRVIKSEEVLTKKNLKKQTNGPMGQSIPPDTHIKVTHSAERSASPIF